jgi:CMP-N-acetylneuraminic acid synthetase
VLVQTLQNFELLIIDDGSTDNSREVIEPYRENDKVIVLFQENLGLNKSNNVALNLAKGKYLVRLDADDFLDPHALEILVNELERDPDCGLVFADYYLVDEDEQVIRLVRRHNFKEVTLLDQPAHGACTLFRKQCLLDISGYQEIFSCQDGYDIWLRFIEKFKVTNVNLPLFYYRQHQSSLTRNEERILITRSEIVKDKVRNNDKLLSKAIAIIPVRGSCLEPGSLALEKLGEQALIDWTINCALQAERISDVVVSTPDSEIIEHVRKKYSDKVFIIKRELEMAKLNTHIEDTLLHALEQYGKTKELPEYLSLLYIESPFRRSRFVDQSLDVLDLFAVDSVVSVRPENEVLYQHTGSGLRPLHNIGLLRVERETIYREVGKLHAVKASELLAKRNLHHSKVGHIEVDHQSAFSIQSKWDWSIAENIASKLQETF